MAEKRKRTLVYNYLINIDADIYLLQETHNARERERDEQIWRWKSSFNQANN